MNDIDIKHLQFALDKICLQLERNAEATEAIVKILDEKIRLDWEK